MLNLACIKNFDSFKFKTIDDKITLIEMSESRKQMMTTPRKMKDRDEKFCCCFFWEFRNFDMSLLFFPNEFAPFQMPRNKR